MTKSCKRAAVMVATLFVGACASDGSRAAGPSASGATTSSSSTTPSSTTTSTTALTSTSRAARELSEHEALEAFDFGVPYAGDCASTNLDRDVNKWCSKLHDDRGTSKIYAGGPTFSEFTLWLLLEHGAAGWRVANTADVDDPENPTPPPW